MPTSQQLDHFNAVVSAVVARAEAVGLTMRGWSAEDVTCQVLELRHGDFNAGYVEIRQTPDADPALPTLKGYLIAPGEGRPVLRTSYMLDGEAVVTDEMDANTPGSVEAGLAVLARGIAAIGQDMGATPPEFAATVIDRNTVAAFSWMVVNALEQARENIAGYASDDAAREYADLERVVTFLGETNLLDAERVDQLRLGLDDVRTEIRTPPAPRP